MDIADKANDTAQEQLERDIEAARGIRHLPGPKICRKCEEPNDQWAAGLAICSGCMEENEDG